MRIIIVILIALTAHLPVASQISHGGKPYAQPKALLAAPLPVIELPVPDVDSAISADSLRYLDGHHPLRFALNIPVCINLKEQAQAMHLPGQGTLYRLRLSAPGALSLSLLFDKYHLPHGARLFVYSPLQDQVLGAFTHDNNKENRELRISPIDGEGLIVEYFEPISASNAPALTIRRVSYGYKQWKNTWQTSGAGSCNININCPEGQDWQIVKRSVVKLIIGGNEYCSGTLMNNSAVDGTPYILTAEHCIGTAEKAEDVLVFFNYESANCSTDTLDQALKSVSGSRLRAMPKTLDCALLELTEIPPLDYNVYYAGYDARGSFPAKTVTIHHPSGDIKKISFDDDAPKTGNFDYGYDPNTHWNIEEWDAGVTEGGSSGAPLFDESQNVIGTLSGGRASCGYPKDDYYQKLYHAWADYTDTDQQLKTWLDPMGFGIRWYGGFDPATRFITCGSRQSNISATAGTTVANQDGRLAIAERFVLQEDQYVTEVKLKTGNVTGHYTQVQLSIHQSDNGKPGLKLNGESLMLRDLKPDTINTIAMYPPVYVKDEYFVVLTMPDTNSSLTVYVSDTGSTANTNTAWMQLADSSWHAYSENQAWGQATNHYMEAGYCLPASIDAPYSAHSALKPRCRLSPNPAQTIVSIESKNAMAEYVEIYNMQGQVLIQEVMTEQHIELNIEGLKAGSYMVSLTTDRGRANQKLIVIP